MHGIFIALLSVIATTPLSAQNECVHLELIKSYSTAQRYNRYFPDELR